MEIEMMFKIPSVLADALYTSTYLTLGLVPASISAVHSPKFNYTVVRRAYAKCRIKRTTYYKKEF